MYPKKKEKYLYFICYLISLLIVVGSIFFALFRHIKVEKKATIITNTIIINGHSLMLISLAIFFIILATVALKRLKKYETHKIYDFIKTIASSISVSLVIATAFITVVKFLFSSENLIISISNTVNWLYEPITLIYIASIAITSIDTVSKVETDKKS